MDVIMNGEAHGSVASRLLKNNFDVGAFKPWVGEDDNSYVTLMERNSDGGVLLNSDGKPKTRNVRLASNTATLRKEEWIELDRAVVMAARPRLKLVGDIRGTPGLTKVIPNGLSKTSLDTESMSDPGEALVSMDGTRKSKGDRPQFDLKSLPLPIIHSDFGFSARQIATSRNIGGGIDVSMAEAAGRRVAEIQEQMFLGVGSPALYAFAGGTIYGLTNFNHRITVDPLTSPESTGWTPQVLLAEFLGMKEAARAAKMYGPFMVYVGTGWEQYLDRDWSSAKGDVTLRDRLLKVNNISGIASLDYLTDTHEFDIVLVQMTSDVIRAVVGMEITTVQWEEQGGMLQNFKVMCIVVPQVRADYNNNCGIVHGAIA